MGSKRKKAGSHWSLVKFIRKLFCGNKRKKAKKEKKHEEEPSSSFETSGETNSPAAVCTSSSSNRSPPKPSTKLVTGNEQVVCFNAGVNAKKIEQVKKSIEKAVNKQKQHSRQNGKFEKPTKETPKKTTQPKSNVGQVISRRDKDRLEERRTKLKQLKSRDKIAIRIADQKSHLTKSTTVPMQMQLPIGARGFAQGPTNRPNRFELHYLPRPAIPKNATLSSSEPSVEPLKMIVLFQALISLNSNLEIALRSYKDIVKSLIKLQVPATKQKEVSKKWNSGWLAEESSRVKKSNSKRDYTEDIDSTLERMTVARLLAPATRCEAMIELEELVDELNVALDDLHVYYDYEKNEFDTAEYKESEFRITMDEYEMVLSRTEKLRDVVEKLVEHYSNELISMFDLQANNKNSN